MKHIINKQTAVEWLVESMQKLNQHESPEEWNKLFEQAKEMEKEQLNECYNHGSFSLIDMGHGDTFEQYYKETYGKE